MTLFLVNVLLSLAWMALTGIFSFLNLVVGYALGYLILWMAQQAGDRKDVYFIKVKQGILLVGYFVWQVIKANLRLTHDILTPQPRMSPGIIAIPLRVETKAEITLLASMITLTPGTLSLDVSTDRRVLYIHAMYIDDVDLFKKRIREEMERRLLEVTR